MASTDTHPKTEELLEAVFSVWSVPSLYGQLSLDEILETAMKREGGWCETAASLQVSWNNEWIERGSSANKDMNTEAEVATALKFVTRRQLVKMQQTEKS
jgi:hypothetical protein